jgi:hypothetical protein
MNLDNLIAPDGQGLRGLDWLLTVRFYRGEDDDLIEFLRTLPDSCRATAILAAVCTAAFVGMTYDGHWKQGPHRDVPDMRITVRFRRGEDDHAMAFLQSLTSRKRSAFVRKALRTAMQGEMITLIKLKLAEVGSIAKPGEGRGR